MVQPPINDLIKDHLFQQNAIIWLTQPSVNPDGIVPILYKQGYSTLAIGRLLALPADVRQAVKEADITVQNGANPDFVLIHQANRKYLLVECKENSFGTTSTKVKQARTLMLMAGERAAEILGLATSDVAASFLGYVLPEDKTTQFSETLDHLRKEMSDLGLPWGDSSVFGLGVQNDKVCLLIEDKLGSFMELPSGVHPFLAYEPGTDPRPFYFLPYQPGLEQSDAEENRCKLDLLKRLQQSIVAELGKVRPPTQLYLTRDAILNRAYWGIYEIWEDRDDRKHLRKLCNRFLNRVAKVLYASAPKSMVQDGSSWKVTIGNDEEHNRLMNALLRFGPEVTDLSDQPQLPENDDEA